MITKYTEGTESKIRSLFKDVFGRTMSLDEWKWRFADNPFDQYQLKCIWKNKELIGHTAFTPVESFVNHKLRRIYLSGSSMIHPGFRGEGLFPVLLKDLMQEYKHIDLFYGFPNNQSLKSFIQFAEWELVHEIYSLRFDLSSLNNTTEDLSNITNISGFPKDINNLIQELKHRYSFILSRNATFLNWRINDKPDNNYKIFVLKADQKITGYIVLKIHNAKDELIGDIVDILSIEYKGFTTLIQFAMQYFRSKAQSIHIIMTDPFYSDCLQEMGFQKNNFITNFCIYKNKPITIDYSKIYLTMIDSDIF